MGLIKEPIGIDLTVSPMPITDADRLMIHEIIEHYKKTGEVLQTKPKKKRIRKQNLNAKKGEKALYSNVL